MIEYKIINKLTIFFKVSICLYLIIFKTIAPNNTSNINREDPKLKYYFPNLSKINKFLKINYFERYIKDCKNRKNFNRIKINNESPFLSVCICSYNTEKYAENAILSILNQSFQDFEIIIIDDFSSDNSNNIFKRYQEIDNRFKIFNHEKNLGIYRSRVDAINNSKGKYILFVDADDMILNPYLFEILFSYSSVYNFDIIEFLVLYQAEGRDNLVYPPTQILTHIHNYSESIIYQPELSMIIFYIPRTKIYSSAICRTLWNKIYKKDIFLNSIKYIGDKFYNNSYLNYAEDTIINILNFHFARNYTNINIHGYMYNVRINSISRFTNDTKKRYILNSGIYYYLQLFYKYIIEFDMDRQLLYLEFELFNKQIMFLKKNDPIFFKNRMNTIFEDIINDEKASTFFKSYIRNLTKY